MPQDSRAPVSRLQRTLAYFALALVGLSVIAIVVILIVGGAGVKKPAPEMTLVYVFPVIALPLGALCFIGLLVAGMVERRKLNSGHAK